MRNRRQIRHLDDKKNAQSAHFKKRVRERYNIFFNNEDKRIALEDIRSSRQNASFISAESRTRETWVIVLKGVKLPVVYDRKRHNLVTCLDWEWVTPEEIEKRR